MTSPLAVASIASAGAAVLHATAAGVHADHTALSRLFIALALAQAAAAVAGLVRANRFSAVALVVVNGGAAIGWLLTRLTGISWIAGLEVAERPQLADTTAAILAVVAVAAAAAWSTGRATVVPARAVANAAVLAALLVVPGLVNATSHDHGDHSSADDGEQDAHDHSESGDQADGADSVSQAQSVSASDDDHAGADHTDHTDDDTDADHADHTQAEGSADESSDQDDHGDHDTVIDVAAWPRPWNPAQPFDFAGVPGVTAEQQGRAEQLVSDTLRDLPAFADVDAVPALGFRSIGDASTGFEHYINSTFIGDDRFLDPTAPESLVYAVNGDERTLVSAMYIANDTPIDDPLLTDFGGPLMQWHVHDNLCWGLDEEGVPVVRGVLENFGGVCPRGTVNAGGENPMVHVWIAPHQCGPFAALEGHGAGQADAEAGTRTDQCSHGGHDDHGGEDGDDGGEAATVAYDPELPIDLGGVDGVTLQQQAFAENLVGATVRDLPQWADLDAVDAAGFRSIGDGGTGHEHYIQWDWIDDDVWLDPDYPESLVFEPQPDGTKQLVSAMFMLPSGYPLDEIPDWGGELMQWHVHGDLCFTDDPVAPQVAGVKALGTSCRPPLIDGTMAPMIHVWIRPHECGPFAALDGIGGGQVPDGEAVLCDQAHGSH